MKRSAAMTARRAKGLGRDAMAAMAATAYFSFDRSSCPNGERELTMMRWGFPPPPNLGNAPVTNVRNLKSPYWRGWLKALWRCLVPATSFCEWTAPKVTHWFALDEVVRSSLSPE